MPRGSHFSLALLLCRFDSNAEELRRLRGVDRDRYVNGTGPCLGFFHARSQSNERSAGRAARERIPGGAQLRGGDDLEVHIHASGLTLKVENELSGC